MLVVENNGMGYEIYVSANVLFKMNTGDKAQLFTYFQVKEDGVALYGFGSREEKAMFLKLITVGSVGCKLAMTVLSGISVRDLAVSVLSGDVSALTRVKGVGKKTAERIILELKEKVGEGETLGREQGGAVSGGAASDAVLALAALGYTRGEADKLVRAVFDPALSAEELITKALKGGR